MREFMFGLPSIPLKLYADSNYFQESAKEWEFDQAYKSEIWKL